MFLFLDMFLVLSPFLTFEKIDYEEYHVNTDKFVTYGNTLETEEDRFKYRIAQKRLIE